MFVARFNRREEGGYTALYGKGSKQLQAILIQEDGKWQVESGLGVGEIEPAVKIRDVKAAWGEIAARSYGDVAPQSAPSAPPDSAPTPPRAGPPSLRKGPPSLKRPLAVGGITPEQAEVIAKLNELNKDPFGPSEPDPMAIMREDVAPGNDQATEDTPCCEKCGRQEHGWRKDPDGRWRPPCRCVFVEDPQADYAPDFTDKQMWDHLDSRLPSGMTVRDMQPSYLGALDHVYHWMLRNREYVCTDGKLDAPWAHVQRTLFRNLGYAEYRPEVWENK